MSHDDFSAKLVPAAASDYSDEVGKLLARQAEVTKLVSKHFPEMNLGGVQTRVVFVGQQSGGKH